MKKSRLVILSILILLILTAATVFGYYSRIMQPLDASSENMVDIVIPKGQSLSKTAIILTEKKIIRSPLSLKLLAYLNKDAKVQAGRFRLSPSMTPAQILTSLNTGKLDYWVTFLEGWRREEFATALNKAASENNIEFDEQQFLNLTDDKEGYLFPDSYLFPLDASVVSIVSVLESTLDDKFTEDMELHIQQSGKTKHQILTMASLLEREARSDKARQMVSGILWKRFDADWPLQVDATLQYAKGYDPDTKEWWDDPIAADKQINSAYNTYLHNGLPPGPICAPSESSINAAIYPQANDYWYYISDLEGVMHYSKDLAEHNQNIDKYLR